MNSFVLSYALYYNLFYSFIFSILWHFYDQLRHKIWNLFFFKSCFILKITFIHIKANFDTTSKICLSQIDLEKKISRANFNIIIAILIYLVEYGNIYDYNNGGNNVLI